MKLICGGKLVTPDGVFAGDLAIEGTRIAQVAAPGSIEVDAADEVYDAAG